MPASTVVGSLTFTNLGPLTTTFTAPAACYTPTSIGLAPTRQPGAVYYESTCASQGYKAGTCLPAGSIMDDNFAQTTATYEQYFSPGVVCPDTWTTVGVAARQGEGTAISATGLFAPTEFITRPPPQNPGWNVAMQNLAISETVVACCPSGYTAPVFGGRCYSNMPQSLYTATTGCIYLGNSPPVSVTFVYNGTTATGIGAAPGGGYTTQIEPLDEDSLESFTGITVMPMVTMYHRAEDLQGVPSSSPSTTTASTTPSPQSTNVGAKLNIMGGDGTMGAPLTVWAGVAMLGAILFGAA